MFAILLSAVNVLLGFVLRSVVVKFVLYFGLFFVTTEFIALLTPYLPTTSALTNSLAYVPSSVWYFLDLFNVSYGFQAVLSAFATRFIVRRIPLIG